MSKLIENCCGHIPTMDSGVETRKYTYDGFKLIKSHIFSPFIKEEKVPVFTNCASCVDVIMWLQNIR